MASIKQPPNEPNTRLRAAMANRRISMARLATVSGVNVKTVQRWLSEGRLPHPDNARKAARALELDANWLWPQRRTQVNPELINLYAHADQVPTTIWTQMALEARRHIDIATDAAVGLPHGIADIVRSRLRRRVAVRLCLSAQTASTVDIPGATTRTHPCRLEIDIFRFDQDMLVVLHAASGTVGNYSPVLHLRRREDFGVFDFYRAAFDQLWDGSAAASAGDDKDPSDAR